MLWLPVLIVNLSNSCRRGYGVAQGDVVVCTNEGQAQVQGVVALGLSLRSNVEGRSNALLVRTARLRSLDLCLHLANGHLFAV